MSCTRADGSVTWQRQDGVQGRFFPLHDLAHYAVETVLGYGRGFYGLVAEGWDLSDFGTPWPRGPIPADADPAELIVGLLDMERAGGSEWSTAAFNMHAAAYYTEHGLAGSCVLTERNLQRIREKQRELFTQWAALPAGGSLELAFNRPKSGSAAENI